MRTAVVAAVVLACGTSVARAEAWYEGPRGKKRVLHLSLTAGLGLGFVASETWFKPSLAPDHCRWCDPPWFDRRARDSIVWEDLDQARSLSNVTGYIALPTLGIGVTLLSAVADDGSDGPYARVIDDVVPVLETVTVTQAIVQTAKWSVGRARPFVRFGTDDDLDQDKNLSFFSGHSALAFGITTSAAMVARYRKSRLEPYIWAIGLPLSAATAYLRMAADRHYFSDVVVGSLVGVAGGLVIPRWTRSQRDVAIVPSGSGAAIVGSF